MKSLYLFLLAMVSWSVANSQINILFVDDSDDTFGNAESIFASIQNAEYPVDYYNAVDSVQSPSLTTLSNYDMVVWHTGSSSANLAFWSNTNEDNYDLVDYLDKGGKMWLIGNDFLYARYATVPTTFKDGDFVYNYLGIKSYDAQTFNDDGALGLVYVYPEADAIIPNLDTLDWIFPTLYYADAVSLTDDATSIYAMGDESYPLSGATSGLFMDNGTFQVLSYCFDLALVKTDTMRDKNVKDVLGYFNDRIVNLHSIQAEALKIKIGPVPATDIINISFDLPTKSQVSVDLYDMQGHQIGIVLPTSQLTAGNHNMDYTGNIGDLPSGYYMLNFHVNDKVIVKKIILQ